MPLGRKICGETFAESHNATVPLNSFEDLFDLRCPRCDRILLIVSYPTFAETRAAAAAGHPRAIADLPQVVAQEAFLARAEASELKDPEQLPELDQAPVVKVTASSRANGEVQHLSRKDERGDQPCKWPGAAIKLPSGTT